MSSQVWAQEIEVSGTITDTEGLPLAGATVLVKGTSHGKTADFDGNYKINTNIGATLVFSYAGFMTQEVKVTSATINVQMTQGAELEEVVVVGYSTRKEKKSLGYAISTVESGSSDKVLSGTASGVSVTSGNGLPHSILTAGEINDLKDWNDWKSAINKEQYVSFQKHWNFFLQRKIKVEVKDTDGNPVNNVKTTLYTNDNKKIMSVLTDVKGEAFVFLDFDTITNDDYYRIQLECGQKIIGRKILKHAEKVAFVFENKKSTNSVDIMFTIDATGSMGDEINYLKAELEDIMNRVAADENIDEKRVALAFYRDKGDSYVVKEYDFETNISKVQASLNENDANGGGDYEEAVEEALEKANALAWNPVAKSRLMFLILDAPPHFNEQIVAKIKNQITKAQEKGIKIIPIVASGANKDLEFLMRFFSISTNGTYVFLTDDSGVGNPHLKPTKDDFKVEKLNDLIVRLIKESVQTNA